ncbi:MAG: diguanylate cyclase domain-containing protein, partial [Pirellulales bacterium]
RGDIPEADPVLTGRLAGVITTCRACRHGLSLLLMEMADQVGRGRGRGTQSGTDTVQDLVDGLKRACGTNYPPNGVVVRLGARRLAMILPECERQAAVEVAHHLARQATRRNQVDASQRGTSTNLHIGVAYVAVPSKNFRARDLIESAQRCLFAARTSSGSAAKSIEVY